MSVQIEETRDIDACIALRRIVFMDEQGISEEDEIDDLDDVALHLLALDGDRPVGTARLLVEGDVGKIGRICVLKDLRGTGLGAALVREGIARLSARGDLRKIKLGAQCHALGFYEKLGFAAYGEVYDDAGIPHQDMALAL